MTSSFSGQFNKLKRKIFKYLLFFRPLFIPFLIILFLISFYFLLQFIFKKTHLLKPQASLISSLINPAITSLDTYRDRYHLLILGRAGGDHQGADLTDTLILVSVNIKTADTIILSLPRDIWVESLQTKLNSVYYFGQQKNPPAGLTLVKSAVSEITNQPIHQSVVIDFTGFQKAVDILGGIDLVVPHGFVDDQYPIPGKENIEPESERYQTVEFQAGPQHMDGDQALKYVRSRHSEGEEGSDFSRAQRQQLVILSLKDKLLSPKTFLNLKKLKALKQIFESSVVTDIQPSQYLDLFKLVLKIQPDSIRTGILNQGSFSEDIPPLLYNPPISQYNQWVLLPVNNDWQSVYDYVQEIIYQTQ